MNRREALQMLAAGSLAVTGGASATAQGTLAPIPPKVLEPSFVWTWQMAQRERPRELASWSRIAPESEAGTPLLIRGRLFHADGIRGAAGAVVFAYHTDSNGRYAHPAASRRQPWRLRGWARTDAEGRFSLATIRPAPYPDRTESAHVHLTADGDGIVGQVVESLRFAGDDLNTPQQLAASAALDRFAFVRPVVDGQCELNLRLTGEWPF